MQLLFKLGRPVEVVARGYSFIISFSKTLALHEVSGSTNQDSLALYLIILIPKLLAVCLYLFHFYLFFQNVLPFCLREVWVITACLAIISSTSSVSDGGLTTPDIEKEFYRLHGDLHELCRIKVMFDSYN